MERLRNLPMEGFFPPLRKFYRQGAKNAKELQNLLALRNFAVNSLGWSQQRYYRLPRLLIFPEPETFWLLAGLP